MTLPFALPDWLPWWVAPVHPGADRSSTCSCSCCMPFSVFGVKGRLDSIDARLDEIQGEIRALLAAPAASRPAR